MISKLKTGLESVGSVHPCISTFNTERVPVPLVSPSVFVVTGQTFYSVKSQSATK